MTAPQDWDHPPRNTAWTVVRAKRVEVHGEDGTLLASARADRAMPALYDAAGRLAVTLRPEIKKAFSVRNLLRLGAEGILFEGQRQWYDRNPIAGPPLLVTWTRPQIVFAAILPVNDGSHVVNLLPTGPLNDRLLRRSVSPETATRLRACNPLTVTNTADGTEQLGNAAGRVFARAAYAQVRPGTTVPRGVDHHPQSVEVLDNDLPAVALYAILVGAHGWHS